MLHLGITVHKDAVCFDRFSFSGGGLVTSYSGEFGEILCGSEHSLLNAVFLYCKHRKVRFKQEYHPYSHQRATSRAAQLTSSQVQRSVSVMKRLHKQGGTEF